MIKRSKYTGILASVNYVVSFKASANGGPVISVGGVYRCFFLFNCAICCEKFDVYLHTSKVK